EAVGGRALRFVCVTPDSPRALPAAELADFISNQFHLSASIQESPAMAVRDCLKKGDPTVAFGSLYLAGTLRKAVFDICGEIRK
ncbi:MAG: hypothetical protein LUB63_04220, partial [Oscillospiraceae bacterium]|nr:hypothetical protein [Oscillospiraceae bacterium]